jgi:hypothetical protein
MGPCFTLGFSPQAISPQVRGHDVASRADLQAPVTEAPPAADPSTVTVPAEPCASGDQEPPPWCPPELRRTLTRMTRGEQGPRGGLAGVGDLLEGPPSAEDGHKTERDYRAVMREQIRRARAAGYDVGRRPWEDAP